MAHLTRLLVRHTVVLGACLVAALSIGRPAAAQSLNFSQTAYSTAGFPTDAAFADLNGDDIADVVVAGGRDELGASVVSVRFGNGDGSFGPAAIYVSGARWANNAQFVRVADLTNDGKLDIVTAGPGDGHIYVLPGNGVGQFGPAIGYETGLPQIVSLDARSIPPDNSGNTGMAIVGSTQPCSILGCGGGFVAQLFSGTGPLHGVFWPTQTTSTASVVVAPTLAGGAPTLQSVLASSLGLFGLSPGDRPFPFPNGFPFPPSMTAGPFAGADPFTGVLPDLIVGAGRDLASTIDESVIIVRNFTSVFATIRAGGGTLFSPSLGDIDGDGHLDLVAINAVRIGPQDQTHSLVIYYGTGLSFSASQTIPLPSASSARALSMAGQPGLIAVTDRTAGTLTIFTPGASPVHVDAGPDQIVLANAAGTGTVHVVGGVTAAGGGVASVSWSENGTPLAATADAMLSLGVGVHVLTFSATNTENNVASDTMTVTVQPLAPALVGPTGAMGPRGETGLQGEKGDKGDPGQRGQDGVSIQSVPEPAGANCVVAGVKLTPMMSDGTVAGPAHYVCHGLDGAQGAPGPQGATGAPGPRGEKGDKGDPGPAGAGLFRGALQFVQRGTPVPAGYTRIGSFRQTLNGEPASGRRGRGDDDDERSRRVVIIDVYRKD